MGFWRIIHDTYILSFRFKQTLSPTILDNKPIVYILAHLNFSSSELDANDEDSIHDDDDVSPLNADSIQMVFQCMINMTSLNKNTDQIKQQEDKKLKVVDPKRIMIKKVKCVGELPYTMVESTADKKPQLLGTGCEHGAFTKRSYMPIRKAPSINDRQEDKTKTNSRLV